MKVRVSLDTTTLLKLKALSTPPAHPAMRCPARWAPTHEGHVGRYTSLKQDRLLARVMPTSRTLALRPLLALRRAAGTLHRLCTLHPSADFETAAIQRLVKHLLLP